MRQSASAYHWDWNNKMEPVAALAAMNEVLKNFYSGTLPLNDVLTQVFELGKVGGIDSDVALTCLNLLKSQKLTLVGFNPFLPQVLSWARAALANAAAMQQATAGPEWRWEWDYEPLRNSAAIYLDLLGYLPRRSAVQELGKALTLLDPQLKAWTILSLLRQHHEVDTKEIAFVAADNEARIRLWRGLRELKLEILMPRHWCKPEQLAASSLAEWANHPQEFGAAPEEIELVRRFPVEFDGNMLDVYLFRFRMFPQPWKSGGGWMAGIAGPFLNGEELGTPWSHRCTWSSATPEEHFEMFNGWKKGCKQ